MAKRKGKSRRPAPTATRRKNATRGASNMGIVRKVKRAGDMPTNMGIVRKVGQYAPAPRKRNGEEVEAVGAKKLFEKFHQKRATSSKVYAARNAAPKHLARLGEVVELHVASREGKFVLKPKGVQLTATPNGKQMYFVGGDQASVPLRAMGVDGSKDHVKLGKLSRVVYLTEKGFHNFEPTEYSHHMGEDGGEKPELCFDTRNGLMYLVGGSYDVRRPGIVH